MIPLKRDSLAHNLTRGKVEYVFHMKLSLYVNVSSLVCNFEMLSFDCNLVKLAVHSSNSCFLHMNPGDVQENVCTI